MEKLSLYCLFALTTMSVIPANLENHVKTNAPDYTYDMNFTTLFLKPSGNFTYAIDSSANLNAFTQHQYATITRHAINPSYNFAFDLGAQVTLHKKNALLMGNWEHFLSSDFSGFTKLSSKNELGTLLNLNDYSTHATGNATYQLDKMNIVYGQLIEIGQTLNMNLFGGLSFSRIKQIIVSNFTNEDRTLYSSFTTTNSISAVGPEIGFDLHYKIHKTLSFKIYCAGDLLTGTTKSNMSNESKIPEYRENPVFNHIDFKLQDYFKLVSVLTQKIGLTYNLNFKEKSMFQLEAGYQVQLYLNPFHVNTYIENNSNFGLSGPYFKADIAF